jgi:protoheme IX farnesyltransferase
MNQGRINVAERSIEGKPFIIGQHIADFNALVKLRLTLTVVFSSVMAFLIATQGEINLVHVLVLTIGGFLVTGSANIMNQVLERDYDKLMKRTANRPIVQGRIEVSSAVLLSGLMSLFGITFLALFNAGTALLGMVAWMSYAFMYTPLKRVSPAAVPIGAISGALPTLIGCVAAQNGLTLLGLTLFMVQFLWQFTHFWSIGWLGFDDYKKAGYKFIPQDQQENIDKSIAYQAILFAIVLVPVSLLPYYLGVTGVVSMVLVGMLSLLFAYFAWNFLKKFDRKAALQLMFSSFLYIPIVLLLYFFDKI